MCEKSFSDALTGPGEVTGTDSMVSRELTGSNPPVSRELSGMEVFEMSPGQGK